MDFDSAVVIYLGLPLAAVAGYTYANARARRIHRLPIDNAFFAYEVELKVRYFLHAALWGHPFERHGPIGESQGDSADDDVEIALPDARARGPGFHSAMQEVMCNVRKTLAPHHIATAVGIYHKGCDDFRKSAILHVFVARFHQVFSENKHLNLR